MDIPSLVQDYGLAAVFVGAFLEGETVLLLAAASTHLGLLDLRAVLAVAAVGAFLGDNIAFLVGRHFGSHITERIPQLASAVPRVDRLLARWRWLAVIALRFTYGLRIAGPMLIGAGSMPAWEFAAANAVGAVVWSAVIGSLGYAAGHAIERVLGDVVHAEKLLLAIAAVVVIAVVVVHALARRRARRADR
jgi:membrane protein DedA with SNARE-associated domain